MRRKSFLAVAVALCAATAAAPPAQAADEYAYCDPMTPSLDALTHGTTASGALGRGSSGREPALNQTHEDLPASAKNQAGSDFTAGVPVWFHVVSDGKIGSLTQAQIDAQMRVLNKTFAGGEGGYDTAFRFVLAGVTRTDNAKWFYANPGGTHEQTMKATLRRGGAETLNVYSTTAGAYLGWAYLPEITTKPGQFDLDGVVIDWEALPNTSDTYEDRYDEARRSRTRSVTG